MASKFDITALSGVSAGDIFRFQIEDGSSICIGRATECDLVLQDPMVSRRHLTIEKRKTGFYLVDEGSTHGTFHMGFHLKPGPDGARHIHDDDEFKIGDMLFRVAFDETEFAPAKAADAKKDETPKKGLIPPKLKGKYGALAVLALVGALVLLFMPKEGGGLPRQRSNEVLTVPTYMIVGYFNAPESATRKSDKDFSHLDFAQFDIPASDVLVEFELASESKIEVRLDDVSIARFDPTPADSWEIRHLIIRGVALGKQRRLVFDNLDYPRKEQVEGQKFKRWAVRDIRATPLTRSYGVQEGFEHQLTSAIGLVEATDKTPDGVFTLIRALQTAALELIKELKIDAVQYAVSPSSEDNSEITNISKLELRLDVILRGWTQESNEGKGSSSLKEITNIISQLDAELWRRINNRMLQARQDARIKNYIGAHDELLSAMKMFPSESDYRWTLVNRMFMDKKIVPKRVREDPGNFRK